MRHVALLGDSIFDNSSYTRGAPDVVSHLRALLPAGWNATLLALDGATTAGVTAQAARVPRDATDIVLSVGGNDALGEIDLLSTRVASTAQALTLFGTRVQAFEAHYAAAVEAVTRLGRPVTVCTIYNGQLPDPREAALARVALMLFNDAIIRTAFARALGLIDLRFVCEAAEDYANPIEPSGIGGAKIARAIAQAVGATPRHPGTVVTI